MSRGTTKTGESPAQKKAREARNAANAAGEITWKETSKDDWISELIPKGDRFYARIRRSSRNGDGTYSYFVYRNAECMSITRDTKGKSDGLDLAKSAAQRNVKTPKAAILSYVSNHPLEIPPFLALSEEERKVIRTNYPHAAPSEGKIRAHATRGRGDAADMADPSTRRFMEAMERQKAAGAPSGAASEEGGAAGKYTTRGALKVLREQPRAVLALVGSWENPGRPGTKRHAGYQTILDKAPCSVKDMLAAGADEVRLAKCMVKGLLEVRS